MARYQVPAEPKSAARARLTSPHRPDRTSRELAHFETIRAVEKIRSQLPAKLIDAIGPLDDRLQVALARTMADDSPREVYDRIRNALATKRTVR